MWAALHHTPSAGTIDASLLNGAAAAGRSAAPVHNELMRFAGDEYLPLWLALIYLASNLVLNALNFFWFAKMIDAMRKRFTPKETREKPTLAISEKDGVVRVDVDETVVRRRHPVPEEGIDIVPIP